MREGQQYAAIPTEHGEAQIWAPRRLSAAEVRHIHRVIDLLLPVDGQPAPWQDQAECPALEAEAAAKVGGVAGD